MNDSRRREIKKVLDVFMENNDLLEELAMEESDAYEAFVQNGRCDEAARRMDKNVDDLFFANALMEEVINTINSVLTGENYNKPVN